MATENLAHVAEESANPAADWGTWSQDASPVHALRRVAKRWKFWGMWISGVGLVLACASVIAMCVGMARAPSQQVDQVYVPASVAEAYLTSATSSYSSKFGASFNAATERLVGRLTLIVVALVALAVFVGVLLLASGALSSDAWSNLGKHILPLLLIIGAAYMVGPFLRVDDGPSPKAKERVESSIPRMQQDLLHDSFSVPRPDILFVAAQHALASSKAPSDTERWWVEEMAEMFIAGRVSYPDALSSQFAIEVAAYGSPRSKAARKYGAESIASAKRADDISWILWAVGAALSLAGGIAFAAWTLVTRRLRRVEVLLTELHLHGNGEDVPQETRLSSVL